LGAWSGGSGRVRRRKCAKIKKLEHFQEKWNPVFRPKMRQRKNASAVSVSDQYEIAPKHHSDSIQTEVTATPAPFAGAAQLEERRVKQSSRPDWF
jgi:hypothetical protein